MSTATPLDKLDQAIALVTEVRDDLAGSPTFTGTGVPGSEGHVGQALHDLRVLRGRVADPSQHAA